MYLPTLDMVSEDCPGMWSGYVGRFNHDCRIHFWQNRDAAPTCNVFIGSRLVGQIR